MGREQERDRAKCKFCGSESSHVVYGEETQTERGCQVYVECDDCESRGSVFYYCDENEYFDARKSALKSWGYRIMRKRKESSSCSR